MADRDLFFQSLPARFSSGNAAALLPARWGAREQTRRFARGRRGERESRRGASRAGIESRRGASRAGIESRRGASRAGAQGRVSFWLSVSGVVRRCRQTWVRAERSTLRAEARAKEYSRMPGNSSSELTLARSDHELRSRLGPRQLTEQAHAFPQRSAIGPAPTSRPSANASLQSRAAGAARPHLHASQPPSVPSGVKRRCPQAPVRAKRRTPRAAARAKQLSRMHGNTSSFLTLARSDRDQRMRWRPTRTDRTGACYLSTLARSAQRPPAEPAPT